MTDKVYLVRHEEYDDDRVVRAYLHRDEAQAFADAYNAATRSYLEVDEREVGPPAVAYDGPIWSVTWTTRRKMKGEKQLVLVADGFTTVIPSAVPAGSGYSFREYWEYFCGPSWTDIAAAAPEYEEPPVWIDAFSSRQDWKSGDHPPEAEITARNRHEVTARGTSNEACEALVRATAIEVKAELGMA